MSVPELDDFRSLSPSAADLLEERVAEFEAAWARGDRPAIARFLLSPDPTEGQLLVELVYADFEFRARAGDEVRAEDYFAAFPQLRELPAAGPLRALERELAPFRRTDEATERFSALPAASETAAPETAARDALSTAIGSREAANTCDDQRLRPAGAAGAGSPERTTERLGPFDLLERLGAGGFGTVWKARDRRLDRVVALKVPHPHRTDSSGLALLLREARAAARLDHPNIVRIHEVAAEADLTYLAYDYVEGTNLHRWLEGRELSPQDAARLCATLAGAVQHAHDRGVIHRDLKPGNVLIDGDGTPRVTDFGLAKRMASCDSVTRDGIVTGSLPYMSPEQAAGNSRGADHRTDVYGLGAILYELLTGRRPFEGDEDAALRQIRFVAPSAPRKVRPGIPAGVEAICLKALEKEPHRRYATAAELAEDLERFLAGRRPRARTAFVRALSRTRVRRIAIVAAVMLLVVSGSGFSGFRRGPAFEARSVDGNALTKAAAFAPAPPIGSVTPPGEQPPEVSGGDALAAEASRTVEIRTDPGGARVWLFPRDPITGWVMADERIGGGDEHRSPVTFRLKPGEYLIEADLGGGRFLEVDQRVPPLDEEMPVAIFGADWHRGEGKAIWVEFDVPPAPPLDSMIFVPGGEIVVQRGPAPAVLVHVPDLYVARRELTRAEYHEARRASLARRGRSPDDAEWPQQIEGSALLAGEPVALRYYEAAETLAALGLRPLDAFEWDLVMTDTRPLGLERLNESAGEWTGSLVAPLPWEVGDAFGPAGNVLLRMPGLSDPLGINRPREARGGGVIRSAAAHQSSPPGGSRAYVRGARSVKPRWEAEDFVRIVGAPPR